MIHRVGRLTAGENIVLVLAAAAHRQPALDATAFLIDWLKTKAPFWKKEEFADGGPPGSRRATPTTRPRRGGEARTPRLRNRDPSPGKAARRGRQLLAVRDGDAMTGGRPQHVRCS